MQSDTHRKNMYSMSGLPWRTLGTMFPFSKPACFLAVHCHRSGRQKWLSFYIIILEKTTDSRIISANQHPYYERKEFSKNCCTFTPFFSLINCSIFSIPVFIINVSSALYTFIFCSHSATGSSRSGNVSK